MKEHNGQLVDDENRIGDMIVNFYSNLFSSSNQIMFDKVLSGVEPWVSQEMNENLLRPFHAFKVQLSLKQMEANTAFGPNGPPPSLSLSFTNSSRQK